MAPAGSVGMTMARSTQPLVSASSNGRSRSAAERGVRSDMILARRVGCAVALARHVLLTVGRAGIPVVRRHVKCRSRRAGGAAATGESPLADLKKVVSPSRTDVGVRRSHNQDAHVAMPATDAGQGLQR